MRRVLALPVLCLASVMASDPARAEAVRVEFAGYSGCVELRNEATRVVIVPQCGGRVLEYSLNGRNALHLNPAQNGWMWTPGEKTIDPCGGRLDIGPEMTIPRHLPLWFGVWQVESAGPRFCRIVSPPDEATGVQLMREFALDAAGSHLRVTQTIRNISRETKHWCHWSRTLALSGGVFVVPVNPRSRYPRGYLRYGPGPVLSYSPEPDPIVRVRDGFFEMAGVPQFPKYGLDSLAGWLAYVAPNDVLFIKKFPVYPKRVYTEVAAFTVCVFHHKEIGCELEPIGPQEEIRPGKSASFTEDWWLADHPCPKEGASLDLKALEHLVKDTTRR